ncbi:protein kinase, partial [Streptomyces spiralis]
MDDYAGRVLADRYRLPLPPSDEYELTETRAFDTYSGQEVLLRQVPLPEVVEAEVLDADGLPEGFTARDGALRGPAARGGRAGGAGRTAGSTRAARTATRRPTDPAVRRAVEAAQAAARIPDHPRLDQVFDVFVEGGSLWIASELVAARPLAALLAEKPLTPYRAAEVASDILMALRVLHGHGWVHRNITARTVLVCDDGRVMLTGLAVGAAEEALCGYDPVPLQDDQDDQAHQVHQDDQGGGAGAGRGGDGGPPGSAGHGGGAAYGGGSGSPVVDPEAARRAAIEARAAGALPLPGADPANATGAPGALARRAPQSGDDVRAARAGAIAAYRAGARAAARVHEAQQSARAALPGARPPAEGRIGPPGQIVDPYGVRAPSWNNGTPPLPSPAGSGTGGTAPAPGRDVPALGAGA